MPPAPKKAARYAEALAAARALHRAGRLPDAIIAYDRASALDPAAADPHNNRGIALSQIGAGDAALKSFARAIARDPRHADAWWNKTIALQQLGRLDEALASCDRLLALDPARPQAAGERLLLAQQLADWTDFDAGCAAISAALARGERPIAPFALLATIDDPALQLAAARRHMAAVFPDPAPLPPAPPAAPKLRIGYFSADFRAHATMYLIADMLAAHDRAAVEITGFSYGPAIDDAWRQRAAAACDRFIDVAGMSDAEVAALARRLGIDVAIDLKGETSGARLGIFAARAARIQVSYLGFPGSLGAPFLDYLIADRRLVPAGSEVHYAEKLAFLRDCYQPNCVSLPIAAPPDRAAAGLPPTGFVYCAFNASYKTTPAMFALWMTILARHPGSLLWLFVLNPAARANLRRAAARHGVDPDRLVFAGLVPLAEHLARLALADLFLDTAPCNAHTTASDVLRMGVPMITLSGRSFAARVATSLVTAAGVPELAVETPEGYVALALRLGGDPDHLAAMRARLAEPGPLFDPAGHARQLETLLAAMVARDRAGLAPGHIEPWPDAQAASANPLR